MAARCSTWTPPADPTWPDELIEASLDRLGVCNRLNLLLVHPVWWDQMLPRSARYSTGWASRSSLPPHAHPLGHEWALDSGREATSPWRRPTAPRAAALLANEETSGLAAAIVTRDEAAPRSSSPPTRAPARSGTPPPGCSTGSSCSGSRRPGSTSTRSPARAARYLPGPVPAPVRRHASVERVIDSFMITKTLLRYKIEVFVIMENASLAPSLYRGVPLAGSPCPGAVGYSRAARPAGDR